eukprot:13594038-Heterocapsa_arctica.AAC.1
MSVRQTGAAAQFGAQREFVPVVPGFPVFALPHDRCDARVSLVPVGGPYQNLSVLSYLAL